ncbi:Conserved_hypothetical protein [Hexamita inflata]|uniref:EF-hand domain-containing protein n=1 Tax=Hexamita inflata TaxID=28002 RepID=A0AA86UVS5_9EUKA|nr:Conserved hypothetical protein [Hexamita inflata]
MSANSETGKIVRSKLTDTKQTVHIHYNKPAEVIRELREVINMTKVNREEDISIQQGTQITSANLFQVENFLEYSDGNDDRIASQSEDIQDHEDESKDAGSTQVFQRLVSELNSAGSLQSVLSVATINQSIDFSSAKFRQTFVAQSGVVALLKMLNCMLITPINLQERQQFIMQDLQRIEPKVGYEMLLILSTLAEASKDSRRQLLAEEVLKVTISLIKTQFSPAYTQQTLFKARCYRLLSSLLLVSSARNHVRRIQVIPIFIKQFRQAVKDYSVSKSDDLAALICGISQTFESLLKSQRCKEYMIKQKLVATLIESLSTLPTQAHVHEDMIIQTGQNKRTFNLDDMMMESLANNLKMISSSQEGRNDILQANGIDKICAMLQNSKSTKVIQRSVAVLASCAQDSGVDQAVRKAEGLKVLSSQLSSNDFQTLEAICKTIVAVTRSGPYFGCYENSVSTSREYLNFNKRNEENIMDLCEQDTVNQLGKLINQSMDVLADNGLDQDALIVARQGEGDNAKITKGREARQLVVLATQALIPLLSSKQGRATFKSNMTLVRCLVEHLSVGDIDVLIATLAALYTACENDQDICKMISIKDQKAKIPKLSEGVKAMFSLTSHKNIQVVTAAAMALNPICRDKNRAFMIGREIPTALLQLSRLLTSVGYEEQKEKDEDYFPLLIEEQYGWIMGVIAELATDDENAKIFSQYQILDKVCTLCNNHSQPNPQHRRTAYNFHINQLVKEKSALALASLAKVEENMNKVAEKQTIPALVRCIQTPDGVSVFTFNQNQLLGTDLQQCKHPFGSAVNFSLENQVKKMEDRKRDLEDKEAQRKNKNKEVKKSSDKVDKDPQQTANPYSVVNCAACKAMAELSKNKKCALLLRQYGAVYGLLTLAGSEEFSTQMSAAQAITNIRQHHLKALELYKKRVQGELEYVADIPPQGTRRDDQKVYRDQVMQAVDTLYMNAGEITTITQKDTMFKRTSTLSLIKRNDTADRLNGQMEIEYVGDEMFTQRSEIKVEQQAITFTAVVGVLKHPQTEEPLDKQQDNDPIQKELQCGALSSQLKKVQDDELVEASISAEAKKQKAVIKERPPRVAQPLGWRSPAGEAERAAQELFKSFKKEKAELDDVTSALTELKLEQEFVKGMFKYVDEDKDGFIDEAQFAELFKTLQGASKLESPTRADFVFFVMDELQDNRIHAEEFKKFAQRLGSEKEIEEPLTKEEFNEKMDKALIERFFM